MTDQSFDGREVEIVIENLGGIDSLETKMLGGLNVLSGENATNRTSFLRALATGLGGREARVKTDADEPGYVRLTTGGGSYERTVTSVGGSPRYEGAGYLSTSRVQEIRPFAWLLTDNEIREALRSGGDLHEIAMRPVDTDALERKERQLTSERDQLSDRLDELVEQQSRLPQLEERIQAKQSEVTDIEETLEGNRAELAALNESVSVAKEEKSRREQALADKEQAATAKRQVERELEQKRDAVDSLETQYEQAVDELDATRAELEQLDGDPDQLEQEIERLESERTRVAEVQNALRTVISFNMDVLDDDRTQELWRLFETDDRDDEAITERLVQEADDSQIECWTCGSRTDPEEISSQVSELQTQLQSLTSRESDLEQRIDSLREQMRRFDDLSAEIDALSTEVGRLEEKLESRRADLAELEDDLAKATERLETKTDRLDEFEAESGDDVLSLSREISELEVDLDEASQQLDDLREERDAIESETAEIEQIEAELEAKKEALTTVRTTIETREQTIVSEFNDRMDDLVEILAYDNIERVWLTRHQHQDGRRGDESATEFRLNIARQTDEGVTTQDTVDNLSESEREVVAVAFALAGYAAHDLSAEMPFVLFDSFEMIDAERLGRFFSYVEDSAHYLVAALLEEDAQAVGQETMRLIEFGEPVPKT